MSGYAENVAGRISLNQFIRVMAPKLADKDSKAEIVKAFRLFDDDETGKISFLNLKRVAKELGENITDEELRVKADSCPKSGKKRR